jgi:hypothetical protein
MRFLMLVNGFGDFLFIIHVPMNNAACISNGSLQKSEAKYVGSRPQMPVWKVRWSAYRPHSLHFGMNGTKGASTLAIAGISSARMTM